jgi:dipeptidyl aminopeptidase/acylaminoacyl peptidase
MTVATKSARLLQAMLFCLALGSTVGSQENMEPRQKRPITVADGIAMTALKAIDYFSGNPSIAHFSPDEKRFVVVLGKGNLERKTNDYSLLLYETADAFHSPKPDLLLTMSSSSSRDGITKVRWLSDNETIVFLGENPYEKSQVYTFNVASRRLVKLTNHPTAIYDYAITDDGRELVFRALSAWMEAEYPEPSSSKEVVVAGKSLYQVLRGDYSEPEGQHIFWQASGSASRLIPVGAEYYVGAGPISLSPGGHYLVFPAMVRDVPKAWSTYQDATLQQKLAAVPPRAASRASSSICCATLRRCLLSH